MKDCACCAGKLGGRGDYTSYLSRPDIIANVSATSLIAVEALCKF